MKTAKLSVDERDDGLDVTVDLNDGKGEVQLQLRGTFIVLLKKWAVNRFS